MEISICYQDEYIIAVNKPNNVLVHRSYMARNMDDELTLIDLLHNQLDFKLYPIHRLDRKTSGLLLFAKKREYVSLFQDLFKNNEIQKTYHALVRGFIPELGTIDSPVKGRDSKVYKEALTEYKKLRDVCVDIPVHPYEISRYSLVELRPKTGRLHQLRIHMNKISHPIVGDVKYGDRYHNRMFESEFNCAQMFLHASILELKHPCTNEKIKISAVLPDHWGKVSKVFNWSELELFN